MSLVAIRAALETALATMTPPMETAWQRTTPPPVDVSTAYQQVDLLYADPLNLENNANWTEIGFLQVTGCFPQPSDLVPEGSRPVDEWKNAIRELFKRTASFSALGVTLTVNKTPQVLPSYKDGERDCHPVRIPFYAHINA